MWEALHISRSIARPPAEVAAFAGEPSNLPLWAAGLASGIREEDGVWISDSPMGRSAVRFAPGRELGILDHDVTLPDGTTFHNPLRARQRRGQRGGLHALPSRRDDRRRVQADAAAIRADLERLADILEG
ncbi:MAG: SRPBCC family protein [Schumannella sp.]